MKASYSIGHRKGKAMKMEFVCGIASLITIIIIHLLLSKKWETSEKVDKGIMICYWKLSYRRKFIRTLWMIPTAIIVTFGFYCTFRSLLWTGFIAIIFAVTLFLQAFYNYKKWRKKD